MKKIVIPVLLLSMMLWSCEKEHRSLQRGTITGPDLRECVCCGGWYILIGDITYRFYRVPGGSSLDLAHESCPMTVEIEWKKDPDACTGDEIIILYINKI
jgi:hypothetical protein